MNWLSMTLAFADVLVPFVLLLLLPIESLVLTFGVAMMQDTSPTSEQAHVPDTSPTPHLPIESKAVTGIEDLLVLLILNPWLHVTVITVPRLIQFKSPSYGMIPGEGGVAEVTPLAVDHTGHWRLTQECEGARHAHGE